VGGLQAWLSYGANDHQCSNLADSVMGCTPAARLLSELDRPTLMGCPASSLAATACKRAPVP
jgi:hypothetical protein